MGRKVILALAAAFLVVGCASEPTVDMSKEKSPSAGADTDTAKKPANDTKVNPASTYPKHAAGQGDSLR